MTATTTSHQRRRRAGAALALACAAAAATAAGLVAAAPADAGTYTVHSCRTPTGADAGIDGWSWSATATSQTSFASVCPLGGLTLALMPGRVHDRDATANMRFTAPDATTIARYRVWRSVQLTTAERYFYTPTEAVPNGGEEWVLDRCGGLSNSCSAVGTPATPLADANLIDRTPPVPLTRWGAYLSCGLYADDAPDCKATSPISAQVTVWRAETVLNDLQAPQFATVPSGGLLDGGTLSGIQRLSAIATDKGGGVAAVGVEIDGQLLAGATLSDPDGLCREPYTRRVPCPQTASGTLAVDTAVLPDGVHQLRVIATDAGGNATASGPYAITTDNARAVCTPAAAPPGTELRLRTWVAAAPRAARARRSAARDPRRRTVTVARGRAAVLAGQLTGAGGAPVAGAAICVSTRAGDDDPVQPLARLTTDPTGSFSALIPAGTSRQLWAVLRVGPSAISTRAVVRVRPGIALTPSRRRLRAGATLTMRGRLSGSPMPRGGVLVNVQARRGRSWRTFEQVRVGRSGRFRMRYRFVGGPGVHRYALRAQVPEQADYPYAQAASRPFRVRVSG